MDALPDDRHRTIDGGFVRMMDAMPRLVKANAEEAVIQAARVSCGHVSDSSQRPPEQDEALLRYLFRNNHMTPFEMIVTKWCVKAPLFTARQWMRHRTGSFNEQSARYGVVPTEFYMPGDDDIKYQSKSNKQGSDEPAPELATEFRESLIEAYNTSAAAYDGSIGAGVARELARISLPEGRYTTFYWTVNLRNLFHFLSLRVAPDAQSNIRTYASAILDIVKLYCPIATKAFEDYQLGTMTLTALELRSIKDKTIPVEMSAREKAEWKTKCKYLEIKYAL